MNDKKEEMKPEGQAATVPVASDGMLGLGSCAVDWSRTFTLRLCESDYVQAETRLGQYSRLKLEAIKRGWTVEEWLSESRDAFCAKFISP